MFFLGGSGREILVLHFLKQSRTNSGGSGALMLFLIEGFEGFARFVEFWAKFKAFYMF